MRGEGCYEGEGCDWIRLYYDSALMAFLVGVVGAKMVVHLHVRKVQRRVHAVVGDGGIGLVVMEMGTGDANADSGDNKKSNDHQTSDT